MLKNPSFLVFFICSFFITIVLAFYFQQGNPFVASLNPPGVQAGINFAGGGGGDPKTRPQQPCQPQLLERMFHTYGKTAKIPMLWIYAENDMYFGAKYPREWFEAFSSAGGKAEFVQFPPQGDDGHLRAALGQARHDFGAAVPAGGVLQEALDQQGRLHHQAKHMPEQREGGKGLVS